jgi:hypothetical protein
MCDNFLLVKDAVDIIDVAKFYGISVNRHKKAICPFHNDHHPSLSFKNQRFKCFSCGEGGDVIDLVSFLTNAATPLDAVREINRSFHLGFDLDAPASDAAIQNARRQRKAAQERKRRFDEWENCAVIIFIAYLRFLRECRETYAPHSPEDDFHPLFLESLHKLDYTEYVFEEIFIISGTEERMKFLVDYAGMVRAIEQRLIQERVPYADRDEAFYNRLAPFAPVVVAGGAWNQKAA